MSSGTCPVSGSRRSRTSPPRRGAARSARAHPRPTDGIARPSIASRPRWPPSRDDPGSLAGHRGVALLDDALLRKVRADELAPDAAASEHDHAVADRRELLVIRAGADDVHAASLRRTADQLVDLLARPHVDALRRLVEEEQPGLGLEPLREQRLLLVPTREGAVRQRRVVRPHVELAHEGGG